MKRVDHSIGADPAVEEELKKREERRASKKITKAAAAHRMLKKSILPNKKMTFDEEGEVGVPAEWGDVWPVDETAS